MQLNLVFIGKTAFQDIQSGIDRYLDRIRHYAETHLHIVQAEKMSDKSDNRAALEKEAKRIFKLVGQDHVVLWDVAGTQMTSKGLAKFLQDLQLSHSGRLWMITGGPAGVSDRVVSRADYKLSLSMMTLPHDLARLVAVEQIYRAFTINKGVPYHR